MLTVKVFVRAPYDQYVTSNTRFWHASGIDLSLTASGLSVQTQSLVSILIGGIAFETPPTAAPLPAAEAETVFTLYNDRNEAYRLPARDPQTFRLVFRQSVRGLAVGAPAEFRGDRACARVGVAVRGGDHDASTPHLPGDLARQPPAPGERAGARAAGDDERSDRQPSRPPG